MRKLCDRRLDAPFGSRIGLGGTPPLGGHVGVPSSQVTAKTSTYSQILHLGRPMFLQVAESEARTLNAELKAAQAEARLKAMKQVAHAAEWRS